MSAAGCYSQPRPNRLQPVLDVLERLGSGLPLIKLAQQRRSFVTQLGFDHVLFEQATHDPREVIRVGLGGATVVRDGTGHGAYVCCFQGVGYG